MLNQIQLFLTQFHTKLKKTNLFFLSFALNHIVPLQYQSAWLACGLIGKVSPTERVCKKWPLIVAALRPTIFQGIPISQILLSDICIWLVAIRECNKDPDVANILGGGGSLSIPITRRAHQNTESSLSRGGRTFFAFYLECVSNALVSSQYNRFCL